MLRLLSGILGLWLALPCPAGAEYRFSRVVTGLTAPVYVTEPPGDARLFVVEWIGGAIVPPRSEEGQDDAPPALVVWFDSGDGAVLGQAPAEP